MKILKYTYLPLLIFSLLFFDTNVKAATSYTSINLPITNGATAQIVSTYYPNLVGELIDAEDIQQTSQSWWKFEPNFALDLSSLPSGYINGVLSFDITISSGLTQGAYSNWQVTNLSNTDSMHTSITYVRNNIFRVFVFLDNYTLISGSSHIGDLKITYEDQSTAYSATNGTSFTVSMSIISNTLTKSDSVVNNRDTELMYNAIYQATGQNFQQIITLLNSIYGQDYTYYQSLVSSLSTSNTFLQHLEEYTQTITSKITTIDTNITTILSELQSYITFMQTYIPYLQTINTNTLNTYNQLVTIYNYILKRPTISTQIENGVWYLQSNLIAKKNGESETNRKHIVLRKEQNIEYIYTYAYDYTNYPIIIYFENFDENATQNNISRIYRVNTQGNQYIPIDFKYNENYCIINFMSQQAVNSRVCYIGDGYTYQAIMYYIENALNMNQEQSSQAAELESQYADKDSQSSNLLGGLDSISYPSFNSDDLDIMGNTDTNTKINLFGLIGLITNNSFVTTVLIIIVTAMIAGYALYGKK